MEYRELTDLMESTCRGSNNVNWGAFGRLTKLYVYEHIARCIILLPSTIINQFNSTATVAYLAAICKSKAAVSDYRVKVTSKRVTQTSFGKR